MDIIGIICEYNPFHNGHLYHLKKVKELFPQSLIILILSGNFTQRGIPSIINKWDKTEISLTYGIDLIVELPFSFATQSADIFAKGAIQLLNALHAEYLIFGSETLNESDLINLAKVTINNPSYEQKVKDYLDAGENYPTSLNLALKDFTNKCILNPNDLLGFSYIKEILKQEANIKPITIQRTNNYHDLEVLENNISSATSIRQAYIEHRNWQDQVPEETVSRMNKTVFCLENYFPFLQYKIMTCEDLSIYQTVDEGIENRIKKEIMLANSFNDLILRIKTRRYTYNKLCRMFIHILCDFTKEKAKTMKNIEYIRVLGFSENGRRYLNQIKKKTPYPIITTFSKGNSEMLNYEKKVTCVYASVLPEQEKLEEIKKEYQNQPKKFTN